MLSKYQLADAEILQLWAEYSRTNVQTYSGEVYRERIYANEYESNASIDYWGWFVIPVEVLFKPASKLFYKPRTFKTYIPKQKLILYKNRTTVPLRI